MRNTRAIAGLCLLAALALGAVPTSGAAAEVAGTTAFTCVKGAGTLHGEHCTASGTAPAEYGHVAIAQGETTELTGSAEKTNETTTGPVPTIIKWTVSGIPFELEVTEAHFEGTLANKIEETTGGKKDHYIHLEGTIHYTEVGVRPASQHCEVETAGVKGTIITKPLTGTSLNEGDGIRIRPKEGEVITEFSIVNCASAFLDGPKTFTGSFKVTTNGATLIAEHTPITTENTLKFSGVKAGLQGKLTISGRKAGTTGAFTPISATTVET